MKYLLNEMMPVAFRKLLVGHQGSSVGKQGWSGKQNGELLDAMIRSKFEILITMDQNMENQQNFVRYPIPALVLKANSTALVDLAPLGPRVLEVLNKGILPKGPFTLDSFDADKYDS